MTGKAYAAEPVELPMTVAATGKILVDVNVNGKTISCIVDTGSPYFLIVDDMLVDGMHLEKTRVQARLRFFAEDQGGDTYKVSIPTMQIGPFQYNDVQALTLDDIRRATGTGYADLPNFWAQGIIGMAFLEHFRVVIDYPHNRFLLYPPDGKTNLPIPPTASFIIPAADVVGTDKPVRFLLDTGSTFSVVSESAMEPLGMSYLSVSGGDALFKGIAKADALTIGAVRFQGVTMEVADHFSHYTGGDFFQGIVGYDYLKELILDLNFPQKIITLQRP